MLFLDTNADINTIVAYLQDKLDTHKYVKITTNNDINILYFTEIDKHKNIDGKQIFYIQNKMIIH